MLITSVLIFTSILLNTSLRIQLPLIAPATMCESRRRLQCAARNSILMMSGQERWLVDLPILHNELYNYSVLWCAKILSSPSLEIFWLGVQCVHPMFNVQYFIIIYYRYLSFYVNFMYWVDYFIEGHRVISCISTVTCYPLKVKSLLLLTLNKANLRLFIVFSAVRF